MKFTAAFALGLASTAAAAATELNSVPIVEAIAPESVPSKACKSKDIPEHLRSECRSSIQATPYIVNGMYRHGVYELGPLAAVLSNMAHETGGFQFKRNVFPGRPGQGTSNMQMKGFNLEYAKWLPETRDQFAKFDDAEAMTEDELNAMMDVLTDDKYNFGTGAWYYTHKCTAEQKAQFKVSADDGFAAFMECVGVPQPLEDARVDRWNAAKKAFGLE